MLSDPLVVSSSLPLHKQAKKRLRAGKIWEEKSSAVVKSCRNLPHLAWKDKRFQPNTSDGWKSLLQAPCWEILNLKKSYTAVQMKLCFSSFRLETGLRCPASAWTSPGWVWRILTPLATPSRSGVLDLSLISFRNPALQASHTHAHAKSLLLIQHLQLCCICRNERDHVVVFAPLMRCQVIYLWITCLEQPPCAVCIFFYPLWSHVAQRLLMQLFVIQSLPSPPVSLQGGLYLSWHVPGCVGGGSDSLSRCEHPLPYCYMPNKSSPAHKLVQGRIMMVI